MSERKVVRFVEMNDLKGELRTKKITYRKLAERISRSVAWVSDMMNGYTTPDAADVFNICNAADISLDQVGRFFISPYLSKRKKSGNAPVVKHRKGE